MIDIFGQVLKQSGPVALVSILIVIGGGYALRSLWNEIQDLQKRLEEVQEKRTKDMERLMNANNTINNELDRTVDKLMSVVQVISKGDL